MKNDYVKGLLVTAAGIMVLTPDALLIKLTSGLGPLEGALLRSLFMGMSWAVMIRIRKGAVLRPLRSVSPVGLLAGLLLAIDRFAFVAAVQTTTIANTLLIFAAVPAMAAIVSYFVLKERCTLANCIAIAASLAGVAIICGSDLRGDMMIGNALAVLSAVFYTFYLVCMRFTKRDEVLESLCLSGVIGALMALPFTHATLVAPGSLAVTALQGLVLLPVGFALYFSGTRFLPAAEVALIGLLETVLAPVWGWAVIGEVPAASTLAGGAVVVSAILGQALHGLYLQRRTARNGMSTSSPAPASAGVDD